MNCRVIYALILVTVALGQTAAAACLSQPLHRGFQLGVGVQNFMLGNQLDFELQAPGYAVTVGHSWGSDGLYLTAQIASSTNFSLVSAEASYRHIIDTPFMSVFGLLGGFLMSYGTTTSVRHDLAGAIGGAGLIILFSEAVEFDFFLKGYLHNESFMAGGGTFLFRL